MALRAEKWRRVALRAFFPPPQDLFFYLKKLEKREKEEGKTVPLLDPHTWLPRGENTTQCTASVCPSATDTC